MPENSEKYSQLHELISNPAKAELFGQNSLFGNFRGNHTVLKLFVNYLKKILMELKHIPTTLNSKTFSEYLQKSSTEQKNFDKIIKKIDYLRNKGIIVDEPPARNTLRNFGLILNDLGIIKNEKLITVNYDNALEKAINFQSSTQKNIRSENFSSKAKTAGSIKSPESAESLKTAESPKSPESAESSELDKPSEPTESSQPHDLSESEVSEISAESESESTETSKSAKEFEGIGNFPFSQQISQQNKNESNQDQSNEKSISPKTKKSLTEEEIESNAENSKSPENSESKFQLPVESNMEFSVNQPEIPAILGIPQKKAIRKIRPTAQGLRRAITQPERLKELPPQAIQSKNKKTKKQTAESQAQTMEQNIMPQQNIEIAENIPAKNNHLGKKLAKLAGTTVATGAALPFLFGGSTEAEAATIAKNIITFISHLLS